MHPASRMSRVARGIAVILLLTIAAPLARTGHALAREDKPRTVSLAAVGTAKATPDAAHITTGVVSEGKTAREALDDNSAAMARVIAELKAQGLADADIQTTNFSVHPRYEHPKDGKPPVIVGYRVVNSVRITVRDRARLGAILDTVVSLGSNQIGGIQFSVSDAEALKDAARKRAMAEAIRKARLYAAAAGARLGKVLRIAEEEIAQPRPAFLRPSADAKAAPVPIEPGEQVLQVRIQVTWELD